MFDAADASIIAVEPGQIGGKEDSGEDLHISGWVLLFSPELMHGTDLEAKMMAEEQSFAFIFVQWSRIIRIFETLNLRSKL